MPSRKGASVSSQVRHVHKYMIADFADGFPMFPISGACLYPATEMQVSRFVKQVDAPMAAWPIRLTLSASAPLRVAANP